MEYKLSRVGIRRVIRDDLGLNKHVPICNFGLIINIDRIYFLFDNGRVNIRVYECTVY